MRLSFAKKAMAIVLAVLLLTSALQVGAGAAAACAMNAHTPDKTTLYPANWNSNYGGYGDDYYFCSACGMACDANGFDMVFVDASNGCSGGRKCHVPGSTVTLCDGTICYYCSACGRIVDSAGTIVDGSSHGGHTPDISYPQNANYTTCRGGYKTTFYHCQTCGFVCDASGNGLTYISGTQKHSPDKSKLHPADWNTVTGGYGDDYYLCLDCGTACDTNGAAMMFVDANNGCSGGKKCHLPGKTEFLANYTACGGGYKVNYYFCTSCNLAVDAQGTLVEFSGPASSGHTPDLSNEQPANYKACTGGFKVNYYFCTVCGLHCDSAGNSVYPDSYSSLHSPDLSNEQPADYKACTGGFKANYYLCTVCGLTCDSAGNYVEPDGGNGAHTPDTSNPQPANFVPCVGGYNSSFYICTDCGQPCDKNGSTAVWSGPTTTTHNLGERQPANYASCFGGYITDYYECADCHQCFDENGNAAVWGAPTGKHKPRDDKWEANYTSCGGGYKSDYYLCEYCNRACDINGDDLVWYAGNDVHTPDEGHNADWTACGGGRKSAYHICIYCGSECDDMGNTMGTWETPVMDAKHKSSGELHKANYTSCGGGYDKDYYICDVCRSAFDTDGYTVLYFDPLTKHTPDTDNPQPANYIACDGGFKSTWYVCKTCGQPCDANGDDAKYIEPTEKHDLKKVDAVAPTYENDGNIEYWVCKTCNNNFSDDKGENYIGDKDSIIIPKLKYATSVTKLSEVPESVKNKYPTVNDVSKALVEAAFAVDMTLDREAADSVVLDVSLGIKSSDGTFTPVTPEKFPEEGVDVVLAYPEGTDDSYKFVITHMITYGDMAGTIENMEYTLEEDGIHVHFSSMSPVCITYQKTASKPGTLLGDVNGDGVVDSLDAVEILRYYAGVAGSNIDTAAADVDQNGEIDSNDAVAVLRIYAGL